MLRDLNLFSDVFQAVAYWLGCKRKYFRHYFSNEIAVAIELAALFHSSTQWQVTRIECEQPLPLTFAFTSEFIPDNQNKSVYIAIHAALGTALYVIKVKMLNRITCLFSMTWAKYLRRLHWLRRHNASIETRLALITYFTLSTSWLSNARGDIRGAQTLDDGSTFHICRILRVCFFPKLEKKSGGRKFH